MPKEFTSKELSRYNGLKNPAYIAFKGKVYDVSEVFANGSHSGIEAGQDITDIFETSPHKEKIYLKYKVMGNLRQDTQAEKNKEAGLNSTQRNI